MLYIPLLNQLNWINNLNKTPRTAIIRHRVRSLICIMLHHRRRIYWVVHQISIISGPSYSNRVTAFWNCPKKESASSNRSRWRLWTCHQRRKVHDMIIADSAYVCLFYLFLSFVALLVLWYLDAEKKMTFGRVRAFYTVELDFIQFYFEFFYKFPP